MQNVQQQEDKGADVWKNGWHKQERKTTQGMARRHYQVGRDVASETELDGVGQRKLEEVDETGIGHLHVRALSPWLLMMMITSIRLFCFRYFCLKLAYYYIHDYKINFSKYFIIFTTILILQLLLL